MVEIGFAFIRRASHDSGWVLDESLCGRVTRVVTSAWLLLLSLPCSFCSSLAAHTRRAAIGNSLRL